VAKCLAQTLFKTIDEPKLILHHLSGLSRSAIELHTKLSADLPSSSAGQQPHPKNELDAALIDCIGLRLQGHLQLVYNLDERRQERFEESKFSSSYKRNVKGRQPERLRDVDLPLLDDILALAEAAAPGSDDALARSKRVVQLLHDELVKEHLIDADAMLVSPESSNPRRRRIGARTTTHSQQLSLETTDDAATYGALNNADIYLIKEEKSAESQGSPNGVHGSPMQPTSGASTPTPTPPKRRGSSHDHGGSSSAIKRRRSSIVIDLASSASANDGDGDTQSLVDQLLPYAEASDHSENDSSYGRPKVVQPMKTLLFFPFILLPLLLFRSPRKLRTAGLDAAVAESRGSLFIVALLYSGITSPDLAIVSHKLFFLRTNVRTIFSRRINFRAPVEAAVALWLPGGVALVRAGSE